MISKVTFTPPTTGASAVTLHDPANNTERYLAKIDGVVGPPAPRDVTRVRPGVDGIVDATAYFDARTITLEGELWKSTGGASLSDLSTISQAFSDSLLSPGRLEVTYENGTVRWCNCKLAGPIETSVEGASRLVQYQVQLRASDPRWYEGPYSTSEQTTTLTRSTTGTTWSATSSAVNYTGTAPSPLTIVVNAPSGNSLTVSELYVTVPTAYGSLVPQNNAGSSEPSLSIFGSGTGFTVGAAASRTFYSATRTASSLEDIEPDSEFPLLFPGSATFGITSSATNVNGASVAFKYFRAYW